ncbi:urea ABC transporter ATP-binding subunit UrtE [Atrimonas thermophila]|uniref:urea ABC transporter ATP-binding subunit UrtE n=1 Tax=Atrimonas thermophila TaxID=3064161 RepID=UPI00399C9701
MLSITGITVTYGKSPVLREVSLEVRREEAVAILGRNGVGKTTLLRTIMGLHPVIEGHIVFQDFDVTTAPAYRRARLGMAYVPQGRGIFPYLTVEENLKVAFAALYGRSSRANERLLDYAFELFPALYEIRDRKGGNLSGGQQQQLAIARALVTAPRLLLLDEPTEGLQPSIVQQIREALSRIRYESKIGILIVEQRLDFAWIFADRYYVMHKGQIVDSGFTRDRDPGEIEAMLGV